MSRERIRIYFRKKQIVDADAGNVIVTCDSEGRATYTPGTISPNDWEEFTDFTRGLEKLSLSWDANNSNSNPQGAAETNPGGSNYDKGISLDLIFNDRAFQFIDDWLFSQPCFMLNSVEVLISDMICKKDYRIFEIKADNVRYAPFDRPCEYEMKLREGDPVWHCVHKTFIWDNWQNWFIDGGAKMHPCFLTAVEQRPRLIAAARMGLSIFGQTIPVVSLLFNENDNAFRRILNVDNFVDAPLVRDFISNAAGKCGLTVDTLFHDPSSPYYNLCLFYPSSGAWHTNDNSSVTALALWYHFENRWNITLAELLDKLKILFKAEWYVTPNATLIFKPKWDFLNAAPIYDFSAPGALPIWELEYTFDGVKKPAYGRYQYNIDASDLASQEILPLYNDIVDYDGPVNNPMLEGSRSNTFEWAATGYVRDGRAREDFLIRTVSEGETVAYAILILLGVVIAAELAGVLSAGAAAALAIFLAAWAVSISIKANDLRDLFGSDTYTGAVRLTSDQVAAPRLILWNGASMNRAKAVSVAAAAIVPSSYYNPDGDDYLDLNNFQYVPSGVYNYPMYFDSKFVGNMYDRFHDGLDNPMLSLDTNQTFSFYTDNCCEALDFLGAWEGDFAKIGYLIKIEDRGTYEVLGRIEHFEVDYNSERIRIRGKVLKVKK